MNEEQIAAELKQNIPTVAEPTPPSPQAVSTDEPSSAIPEGPDELSLIKLANVFDLKYSAFNDKENGRLKFIFQEAAQLAGSGEYEVVMDKINELLIRQGLKFREDRFMKLWLWLKLSQEHLAIEKEMATLHG